MNNIPHFGDLKIGDLFPVEGQDFDVDISPGHSMMSTTLMSNSQIRCILLTPHDDLFHPRLEGLRAFNADAPVLTGFSVIDEEAAAIVFRTSDDWTIQQMIFLDAEIDDVRELDFNSNRIVLSTATVSTISRRVLGRRDLVVPAPAAKMFANVIAPYCFGGASHPDSQTKIRRVHRYLSGQPIPEAGGYWFLSSEGDPQIQATDSPNGYGLPMTVHDLVDAYRTLRHSRVSEAWTAEEAYRAVDEQRQIAESTGRWDLPHNVPSQSNHRYVAGDFVALKGLYTEVALVGELAVGVYPNLFGLNPAFAHTIHGARSYWLPAGSEAMVLSSSPPDTSIDIRLPESNCIVWFAQPVRIPEQMLPDVRDLIIEAILHNRKLLSSTRDPASWREFVLPNGHIHHYLRRSEPGQIDVSVIADLTGYRTEESHLEGILILADEVRRPQDMTGWLIRHTQRTEAGVINHRSIVPGMVPDAVWGHLVRLLAGVMDFGEWTIPEQLESMPPPSARRRDRRRWQRDIRRGEMRERERAGGLGQIHVLRTRPSARDEVPADRTFEDVSTATSGVGDGRIRPTTHYRTGHFRRQHVGPRVEGCIEVRWIEGVIVNPDVSPHEPRVYVLPRHPNKSVSTTPV